jgi:tetratricopeptide (TPR) repeat protein
MLWGIGALPSAQQVLERALNRAPKNPHLLAALGRVKMARKDYPGAIACYRQAVAMVPQHDSLVALGDLYQVTGQRAAAEQQYALVEAIHRLNRANGVRGDLQLARYYADHDRNLQQALQAAEEEYRARKNILAADTLAWCYFKSGRLGEARGLVEKALARKTPEPSLYFHAGMICARSGDRFAAQKYLYQSLNLNPNFHPVDARVAADTLKQLGVTQRASR